MATRKQLLDQNDNEILPITDTESVRNPQNIGGTLESRLATVENTANGAIKGVQQNGVDLQKDANGKVNVTVQDGEDGLSAFEIAQQQGYTGTVDQWLASLKANIGEFLFVPTDAAAVSAMATIGQTYSSAIDPQGKNVAPTQNTLSVILLMNDDATTPTKTMMIATQADGSSGYEFVYAGDLQSATPSNVLTEDDVDDTQLVNPVSGSLAKAEDVMQLKVKLEGVTASETKASYVAVPGYKVQRDGTLSSNGSAKYSTIAINGAKSVRFLGVNLSSGSSVTTKNTGFCLGHYNGEEIEANWVIDFAQVYDATADTSIIKEYVVTPPTSSTHLRTNVNYSAVTEINFYCYLQSGESVVDLIKKDSNNVVDTSCPFEKFWYMGATSFLPIYIDSSGTNWVSSTNIKSFITAISNVKYIKITTGEHYSRIAFLKNNSYVAGEAPSYCDGTKQLKIEANTTVILNVPNDCNYLYVLAGTSSTDPTFLNLPSIIEKCNNKEVATELKVIQSDVFELMKESAIDLEKNRSLGYIVTIVRTTIPYIGRWYQAQRHYEIAIPEDSKYVKIVGNETLNTDYSFFTEHTVYPVQSNSIPPYVDGVDQAFVIEANETVISKIPEGAKWLYIRAGSSEDNLDRKPQYAAFLNIPEEKNPYDILELNPDTEIHPKMLALQKGSGGPSSTGGVKPNTFIFSHITDCHGGTSATIDSVSNRTWERFLKFSNYWKEKGFIDDIVDTGDIVGNVFSNSIVWRTNADNVLNVIGNHDTATISGGIYNWTAKAGKDAYDKFVSPYIENWGVVQPENADTAGYCYYYKDYERTSNGNTIKLRCIFVDVMGWDDSNIQKTWLDNVLEDARVNGLVVCIFTHFVPVRTRPLNCNFTSKTLGVSTEDFPYHGFNTYCKQLCACVRTFQDNGGIFACYVAGHRHILGIAQVYGNVTIDDTSYDFDDESKPQIVVYGTAGYVNLGNINDYFREANTKNEDNFQIVAIDTFKGINDDIASSSFRIKVLKIGCNYNRHMQLADVVEVTYYPYQPFDVANQNYTIGTIVNKDNVLYRIIKPVYTNGSLDWENSITELASRIVNE